MRPSQGPTAAPALPPVQPSLQGIVKPRPFVKWAGGKRQLLKELLKRVPGTFNTYHEPFVGGGALFFSLCPAAAILGDANLRLMRTYKAVQQQVDAVTAELRGMPASKEFFLAQRQRPIDEASDAEVAAWFIYLNRTAYNGLYRVNRRGHFNVPFGRYENPTICDEDNLRACAAVLSMASLCPAEDFESVLERAEAGDFVYFDPPYIPVSANSSFTRYTPEQFRLADHRRLRDTALELKRRGVHVLLSNSAAPDVLSLYEKGFKIEMLRASRAVNSNPDGRGKVFETLIQ